MNTEEKKAAVAANNSPEEIMEWEQRPPWHWWLLSVLLGGVLLCGIWTVVPEKPPIYLFAIAGFSIAYAIHFLAVSIGINGVILRIGGEPRALQNPEICGKICDIRRRELKIVSCGMSVLAGGLLVLLSGGLFLVFESRCLTRVIYCLGALWIFLAILYYVRNQRHWPLDLLKLIGLSERSRET